jgi:hypothetical protein
MFPYRGLRFKIHMGFTTHRSRPGILQKVSMSLRRDTCQWKAFDGVLRQLGTIRVGEAVGF